MGLVSIADSLEALERIGNGYAAKWVPMPLSVRCHSCSRFYHAGDVLQIGVAAKICLKCYEKHLRALDALAGKPVDACGECGVTFQQLAERESREHVPMFMHMKDGIYQLLCAACDRRYVELRKDLYGPTPFGYHERKL